MGGLTPQHGAPGTNQYGCNRVYIKGGRYLEIDVPEHCVPDSMEHTAAVGMGGIASSEHASRYDCEIHRASL